MTLNKKSLFFAQILMSLTAFLTLFGCANIQRPMGGPRDRTPPKLLKATPANPTKNFSAKVIQLDFDEYFKLNNEYQEITITPEMEKRPEFTIRSKSIFIKLKDTLAKNTTYVINFGKAIVDVNEGNILKNFNYVFSTGNKIDSLSLSGSVLNVETQQKEKDVTVLLFPAKQDTLFGKKKPSIYTTTDTIGNFKLGNLHEGDYKLYALKETTPNRIYDNEDELVAYVPQVIHLKKDSANINLKLFKEIPARLRILDRHIDPDGKLVFRFNKGIPNASVKILNNPALDAEKIVELSHEADTAQIYLKDMSFDSVKVSFLSNNKPIDTLTLHKRKTETYKRTIGLRYNMVEDRLRPGADLVVTSTYPISSFSSSRIVLIEDTVDAGDVKLIKDENNPKMFTIKYPWKQGKQYSINFNIGTFTDIYGDRNPLITKKFTIDKPENYGLLTLKVALPDTGKNYVIQLLNPDNNTVLHSDVLTKSGLVKYVNYPTTKYKVRVIYDANKNGKWDTGDIKLKTQPENIWYYKKILILRPNFDVDEDIQVPKEP